MIVKKWCKDWLSNYRTRHYITEQQRGKKMRKFVYLASPYSHGSKLIEKYREHKVTHCAAFLKEKYKEVVFFLPITQSCAMRDKNKALGTSFESWKDDDIHVVSKLADELWVLTLDGWDQSIGVLAEIKCAISNNVPIRYVNPDTLQVVSAFKFNKYRFY